MAGLNFVGNACYGEYEENAKNVATYEFIPWVLGACESVEQVRDYLIGLNLIGETFAGKYPASSLHWLIADEKQSITVEMVVLPFERHVIYFLQSPGEIIVIRILNQNQDATRHLHWS